MIKDTFLIAIETKNLASNLAIPECRLKKGLVRAERVKGSVDKVLKG